MKKNIPILLAFFLCINFYAQTIPTYYSSVDFTLNGTALKNELATLITNTHTNNLTYSQIWEALKIVDEDPNNNSNVVLLYGWPNTTTGSQARTRSKTLNGGNSGDWNREHTYPKSLGQPNLGESGPGADAHHLRPTDVQWNNNRGNKKFAQGSGNSGTVGAYWYPGDEWKGDVARMMMYMYVRYGTQCLPSNVGVGSTANTPDGMIDLFLDWNAEDPVSAIEIMRNNYLASNGTYAQGNRNPFIDNPYLATKIWGGKPATDTWGILNNKQFNSFEFKVFPNPTSTHTIQIEVPEKVDVDLITIYSVDGKLIKEIKQPSFSNNIFSISFLKEGVYLLNLKADKKISSQKIIVL